MSTPSNGHETMSIGPRPTAPPGAQVPDDRVHGDDLIAGTPTRSTRGEGTEQTPPDGTQRRGPSRAWSWLLVGVGATLLVSSVAGGVVWNLLDGGGLSSPVEQRQTYTQAVSEVRFTGGSGDLQVLAGAPAGTVEVTRRFTRGFPRSEPEVSETWSGETLDIVADCSGFLSWCHIDYSIRVPEGTLVTAETGSGDVAVGGSLGTLRAEVGSGNIDANDLVAAELVASTGSGDIDLDFATPPDRVALDTGSGNVSVRVPPGDAYAVDVTTGSGDQDVTVDRSSGATRSIRIETGSGDARVAYR